MFPERYFQLPAVIQDSWSGSIFRTTFSIRNFVPNETILLLFLIPQYSFLFVNLC